MSGSDSFYIVKMTARLMLMEMIQWRGEMNDLRKREKRLLGSLLNKRRQWDAEYTGEVTGAQRTDPVTRERVQT